ncbi:hypothetical protein Taro_035170 [Colocasia esculenta]|uniref:Uncharacterized protein n=1 Tax=Colocasia esculenta TaxID=4460 RepID=A0A843W4Y8_COLES|nr:hypothetical protein [Colocasia esculenta]
MNFGAAVASSPPRRSSRREGSAVKTRPRRPLSGFACHSSSPGTATCCSPPARRLYRPLSSASPAATAPPSHPARLREPRARPVAAPATPPRARLTPLLRERQTTRPPCSPSAPRSPFASTAPSPAPAPAPSGPSTTQSQQRLVNQNNKRSPVHGIPRINL